MYFDRNINSYEEKIRKLTEENRRLLKNWSEQDYIIRQLKKEIEYKDKIIRQQGNEIYLDNKIERYRMKVACGRIKPAYKKQASENEVEVLISLGYDNIDDIAKELKVSRATIYRRLKKLGISSFSKHIEEINDMSKIKLNL